MSRQAPSREALERLQETSIRYREAFLEVQQLLAASDLGRIPSWTFAIDRLTLEEVAEFSSELAAAEQRRRAWRTALHSLAELMALDGSPEKGPIAEDGTVEGPGDSEHLGKLDRFITIVNAAKAGGCIYLDGRFEPVRPGASAPPQAATPQMPEGAHIELADLPEGE